VPGGARQSLLDAAATRREGRRRLDAANPPVRRIEAAIERDFTAEAIATVKRWLVVAARRRERIAASRDA
jgi:hypothetical protein